MPLCRQRQYSQSTMHQTTTAHTNLLRPTQERRRWWYMGYYLSHFNIEEFQTYCGEDGRLHLEFDEHSELSAPSYFLIIRNSNRHSFVWIHHSPENRLGIDLAIDVIMPKQQSKTADKSTQIKSGRQTLQCLCCPSILTIC